MGSRRQFSRDESVWKGTASELLTALNTVGAVDMLKDASWPKTANALSKRLDRVLPFLRESGIDVVRTKEGHEHKRFIAIVSMRKDAEALSASSASSANNAEIDAGQTFEEAFSVDLNEDEVLPATPPPKGIPIKRPKKKAPEGQTALTD